MIQLRTSPQKGRRIEVLLERAIERCAAIERVLRRDAEAVMHVTHTPSPTPFNRFYMEDDNQPLVQITFPYEGIEVTVQSNSDAERLNTLIWKSFDNLGQSASVRAIGP